MLTETAIVPTPNGAKYVQQLCKHWSHKLDVTVVDDRGTVRFDGAVARMQSTPEALRVAIEAEDPAVLERMKEVLARHLDRFAFREAPLPFRWQATAEA